MNWLLTWKSFVECGKICLHSFKWNMNVIKRNHKYGLVAKWIGTLAFVITFSIIGVQQSQIVNAGLQENIAKEIIRFHVIANSDTQEDQAVKMKVKTAVIEALRPRMDQSLDINKARESLIREMDFIKQVAKSTLKENGFDYEVNVSLKMEEFPVKVYGDVTLPAGMYEALCIRIGKAEGHNWWCIVFPTLCYVDETYSYVPKESKDRLKYVLTDEEYDSVVKEGIKVKPRFKIWEYIQEHLL